jgi:DNA-binding IclR family transcriptional regulator
MERLTSDLHSYGLVSKHKTASRLKLSVTAAGKAYLYESEKAIRATKIKSHREIEYRRAWLKEYNTKRRAKDQR